MSPMQPGSPAGPPSKETRIPQGSEQLRAEADIESDLRFAARTYKSPFSTLGGREKARKKLLSTLEEAKEAGLSELVSKYSNNGLFDDLFAIDKMLNEVGMLFGQTHEYSAATFTEKMTKASKAIEQVLASSSTGTSDRKIIANRLQAQKDQHSALQSIGLEIGKWSISLRDLIRGTIDLQKYQDQAKTHTEELRRLGVQQIGKITKHYYHEAWRANNLHQKRSNQEVQQQQQQQQQRQRRGLQPQQQQQQQRPQLQPQQQQQVQTPDVVEENLASAWECVKNMADAKLLISEEKFTELRLKLGTHQALIDSCLPLQSSADLLQRAAKLRRQSDHLLSAKDELDRWLRTVEQAASMLLTDDEYQSAIEKHRQAIARFELNEYLTFTNHFYGVFRSKRGREVEQILKALGKVPYNTLKTRDVQARLHMARRERQRQAEQAQAASQVPHAQPRSRAQYPPQQLWTATDRYTAAAPGMEPDLSQASQWAGAPWPITPQQSQAVPCPTCGNVHARYEGCVVARYRY